MHSVIRTPRCGLDLTPEPKLVSYLFKSSQGFQLQELIKYHLEPRFQVYTWNIPCISHVYAVLTDIHRIYSDIHEYTMCIQQSGYTWYIHGYPCISIMYIPRISMDIHGISFDVYPWYIRGISMDIPRFLNPDFSAGPCCWSHSKRTQV